MLRRSLKVAMAVAAAVVMLVGSSGCLKPNTEPMERSANTLMTTVVQPMANKAITELGSTSASLIGQGSLIEPGYEISGSAMFGTGIIYSCRIKIIGASANLAASTQADKEAGWGGTTPKPKPEKLKAESEPATTQPAS